MLKSRLRRRDDKGAAAVEFALVMPILLVLVFGIIQYGWYFYAMQSGTSATGDALRRLSVGACQVKSERDALIKSDLGPALQGSTLTTDSVVWKDTGGSTVSAPVLGGSVTITVKYPTLYFHFPLLKLPGNGSVQRIQTARVESPTAATGTVCQ